LKQILSCLNYAHASGIAHRDIKPENILLEDAKRFDQIKIVDWGTAAQFTPKNLNFYEKVGTPYYIAPEVLKENYTSKCDTWSVGVIAYVLLSTNPPFQGNSDAEIVKKVAIGSYSFAQGWSGVSDKAKDFVKQLLCVDPAQRMSAKQALEHPWIQLLGTLPIEESIAQASLNQLKLFKADANLKTAAYAFIASQCLSKKERDTFAMTFRSFDKSSSGSLTHEDLKQAFVDYKVSVDEIELTLIFKQIDQDDSGQISFLEFCTAAMTETSLTSSEKLQSAFRMFDKDGSGLVSAEELKSVLEGAGTIDFDKMIADLDENNDGDISFDEFCTMMKKMEK
jgi:calcium-dependent protein kinase